MTKSKGIQVAVRKYSRIARRTTATLVAVVVAACAATTLTRTWESHDYKGPALKKRLVVGVSKQETVRRTFEDGFVEHLTVAGVDAVASYTLMPEDSQASEAQLTQTV